MPLGPPKPPAGSAPPRSAVFLRSNIGVFSGLRTLLPIPAQLVTNAALLMIFQWSPTLRMILQHAFYLSEQHRASPNAYLSPAGDLSLEPVIQYTVPCPADFATGRGGFLQLLGASLPSCCRCNPAGVVSPLQSVCDHPCCLHPMKKGSAPGIPFRGYLCVHSLRPDDSLAILRWLCR